jgi:hypothetical protein
MEDSSYKVTTMKNVVIASATRTTNGKFGRIFKDFNLGVVAALLHLGAT